MKQDKTKLGACILLSSRRAKHGKEGGEERDGRIGYYRFVAGPPDFGSGLRSRCARLRSFARDNGEPKDIVESATGVARALRFNAAAPNI